MYLSFPIFIAFKEYGTVLWLTLYLTQCDVSLLIILSGHNNYTANIYVKFCDWVFYLIQYDISSLVILSDVIISLQILVEICIIYLQT